MEVRVDLCVAGRLFPVVMRYPPHFPACAPAVRPSDPQAAPWSSHQYVNGDLCLEWGPDTWEEEVTGAEVLESALNLLSIETPASADASPVTAPSRHELSLGQELRSAGTRFLLTAALAEHLRSLPADACGEVSALWSRGSGSITFTIESLKAGGAQSEWRNPCTPAATLRNHWGAMSGYFLHSRGTAQGSDAAAGIGCLKDNVIEKLGCEERKPGGVMLLVHEDGEIGLFWGLQDDKWFRAAAVPCPLGGGDRLSPEYDVLASKRVGIVGLGSVGSKIAVSLARSGIKRFVLVDHDIMMPANVVRHQLDWRDVGKHKVDCISDVLRLTAGTDIDVEARKVFLSGQESCSVVDGVLRALGGCDLIIDATADPRTFNVLSNVATQQRCPFVWAEVFAGGMGGMVARSRPGREPSPKKMRSLFSTYCRKQPPPGAEMLGDYAFEDERTGEAMSASDGDVSVIAAHAARLGTDILMENEPSWFPDSMYLVGLRRWWVFEAPFAVVPLDVGEAVDELPLGTDALAADQRQETINFIAEAASRAEHGCS